MFFMQHLPKRFRKFAGAERLPLMTVLWVSNVCNASCGHCPFNLNRHLRKLEKNPFMTWNIFKKIVDDLSAEENRLIRISGSGEPFMNPDLLKFIVYAKEKNVRVGVITNGSLLDRKKIETMLKIDTDIIEISIDAMDKETYSKIRIGLDFDKVHENINELLRKRKELKSKSKIIVSIINQPDKLKDHRKAVEYWSKIVDKVLSRKWITWNVLDTKNFTSPFYNPEERVPCPWPFERIHITADGDAIFCADDLERKHVMGNVLEMTVSELWNSAKFEKYRQYHIDREFGKIDICENCKDWPYKSWTYNYHKTVKEFDGKK